MQKIILDTIEEFRKEFPELTEYVWNVDKWIITSRKEQVGQFLKQALTKAYLAGQKSREKEIAEIREKGDKTL